MFICPNCQRSLTRMQSSAGVYWACQDCQGRAIALPILRKVVAERCVRELWARARAVGTGVKRCPTCTHLMCEVTSSLLRLDLCKVCQFVWFDAREFEQMPAAPLPAKPAPLPQAARESIALYEVQRMAEEADAEGPVNDWQQVPAIFGLPVECDTPGMAGFPAVTWTTSLLVVIVSVAGFIIGNTFIHELAFIPSEAWRHAGLTLITSFFLHGGVLHLASNLYFLLVFGDNVEEYVGRWRFAVLLLGATVAGDLLHWAGEPRADIPTIGASGGISGVITFYALKFPHARLGMYFRARYRFQWVRFPAWAGLGGWVLLQSVGAAQQLAGFSNVSALAHLGGAAVGFLFWLLWGWRERQLGAGSMPTQP